jgi:formate hydrogenlyase transcriptional activator
VDVRVIAATNRKLDEAVQAGRFRSDLFYRLNVFPIEIPPLRERQSDIPALVGFFLSRFSKELGKKVDGVTQDTLDRLIEYAWPGNIRELQNVLERAVVLAQGPVLRLDRDFLPSAPDRSASGLERAASPGAVQSGKSGNGRRLAASSSLPAPSTLEEVERHHILTVLEQTGGRIEGAQGAARILNLHPNTLRSRMKKLGIKRPLHEIS